MANITSPSAEAARSAALARNSGTSSSSGSRSSGPGPRVHPAALRAEAWETQRNAQLATPEPSAGLRDLFIRLGWTVPEPWTPTETKRKKPLFETDEITPLSSYSYNLSDREWEQARSVYESAFGYAPPEGETRNPIEGGLPVGLNYSQEKTRPSLSAQRDRRIQAEEVRAAPLTWDEYNRLSRQQRAAVDFNTDLISAREKDLNTEYADVTPEQRKAYDEQVRSMFGEGNGSDVYAPEVVGLLSQIDFEAVGQDLDEFLSLERVISMEELKDFKITEHLPLTVGEENTRTVTTNYAATQTKDNTRLLEAQIVDKYNVVAASVMKAATKRTDDILRSVQDQMAAARSEAVTGFGGTATKLRNASPSKLGNVEYFQGLYNYLLDPDATDMGVLWDGLRQSDGVEIQDFLDYADQRSRNERQWGPAQQFMGQRKPNQVRELLGLEKL